MADVLQFPANHLRLKEISNDRGGIFSGWIKSNPEFRARFRIRVKHLRQTTRESWTIKQYRHLGDGLYEIKWEAGKKQCRAMGYEAAEFFVIVLGCTHKDDVYDPPDAVATAKRRASEARRGEWNTIEYSIE